MYGWFLEAGSVDECSIPSATITLQRSVLCGSTLRSSVTRFSSMPTENQLLEHAKQLQGQTTATSQTAITIFAALLIADAIRAAGSWISQAITEASSKR